jgi:pimeloyl-ACP methyl ester carboxylesterase
MATATVNGVRLAYEITGDGDIPLVLVHGSWVSRRSWDLVVTGLAKSFRVVTYDRRGHSESERSMEQGSVDEDAADLASLIEHLQLAPAWAAGNSFGASITLRLAGQRPDLLRGVIAHEPPLFSLLAHDPALVRVLDEIRERIRSVATRIASGDNAGAAAQFVDAVALGPDTWTRLPSQVRQTCIDNAPTFLDEANDPQQFSLDLEGIKTFLQPVLLSTGDRSPPIYSPVLAKLADVLPQAEIMTFPRAGHIPHVTHPDACVEIITDFICTKDRADR